MSKQVIPLSVAETSHVIEMAWADGVPFDSIEAQYGLDEAAVIALMRRELKAASYRLWRKRVIGRPAKHSAKVNAKISTKINVKNGVKNGAALLAIGLLLSLISNPTLSAGNETNSVFPLYLYASPGPHNDITYRRQGPHPEWRAPGPNARQVDARALIRGINARAMTLVQTGEHTSLVVTSARQGSVTALPLDTRTRPVQAGRPTVLATDIDTSMGVAYSPKRNELAFSSLGVLYAIGDARDVLDRARQGKLNAPPALKTLFGQLPRQRWHGGKYIRYTPDEQSLLVNIGAPCNTCLPDGLYGTISRLDLSTGQLSPHVRGVRNSVGFDFDAQGRLWLTSNGADNMGDNFPPDVLTWITPQQFDQARGAGTEPHLGFPYCHAGLKEDPEFGKPGDCARYAPTHVPQWAHSAALGVRIASPSQLPALQAYAEHARQHGAKLASLQYALVAHRGSWNRSTPSGSVLSITPFDDQRAYGTFILIDGFVVNQNGTLSVRGKPVDVLVPAVNQLLISDDTAGTVHAISLE